MECWSVGVLESRGVGVSVCRCVCYELWIEVPPRPPSRERVGGGSGEGGSRERSGWGRGGACEVRPPQKRKRAWRPTFSAHFEAPTLRRIIFAPFNLRQELLLFGATFSTPNSTLPGLARIFFKEAFCIFWRPQNVKKPVAPGHFVIPGTPKSRSALALTVH